MERGSKICKRKYFNNLSHICNHFPLIYIGIILLELHQGLVYLDNFGLFPSDYLSKSILTIILLVKA